MKLYLVRHGESEENTKGLISGPRETPLTEKGKEQAKTIAKRLKNEDFDIAFTSTFSRAKDTAQAILHFHDIPVKEDTRLNEWHRGIFEGRPGYEFKKWTEKTENYHEIRPEGGESLEDLHKRLRAFLQDIEGKYESVLIVSHGGVIRNIIMTTLHIPKENYQPYLVKNATLSILDMKEKKLLAFNE